MKRTEIIQLENICCTWGNGHTLQDYSLTVFSGEIHCIIGVSGSGKTAIEKLLLGEAQPEKGRIYIAGQQVTSLTPDKAFALGIYTIGTMRPMVPGFSIADNLEAVRSIPFPMRLYSRKFARNQAQRILEQLSLPYSPNKRVEELSFLEEQLLSIAKVVQCGARLIILNCVHHYYSDREVRHLARLMTRLKVERGISFLIICERANPFFESADAVQVITRGTDQYQWLRGTIPEAMMIGQWEGDMHVRSQAAEENLVEAVCLRDNRWDTKRSFHSYLRTLKENAPGVWDAHLRFQIPPEEEVKSRDAVLIPELSAAFLAENLSIADNLSLCIPNQAAIGKTRIVHSGMQQVLLRDFQQLIRVREDITQVYQLTEVQKKILSIHRWVLSNPGFLILENPFWGLDRREMRQLHEYLLSLQNRSMQLVVFIRDSRELRYIKGTVITTKNALDPQVIFTNPLLGNS